VRLPGLSADASPGPWASRSDLRHIETGNAAVRLVSAGWAMRTITNLIEKLIDIESSIGVKTNLTVRKQIVEAQDYALELQRELAEVLRGRPQTASGPSPESHLPRFGWRDALASIQRTIF
jgi:hypothetical protein